MDVQQASRLLDTAALLVLAALLAVMLIRSIRGPGVTDRLLSINMIGTLVIASIVVLSRLLGESWLLDVALIYTMISLLSVLILARVYIPHNPERKRFRSEEREERQAKWRRGREKAGPDAGNERRRGES